MKNISLTVKIILTNLIIMSILGAIVIQQSYKVVSDYMQKLENEKFYSIVKTIEPILSINLSLNNPTGYISAIEQLMQTHTEIKNITLIDNRDKVLYTSKINTITDKSAQIITLPIIDKFSHEKSASITLHYTYSLQFFTMISQYSSFLFFIFLLFIFFMLTLTYFIYIYLKPLRLLSKKLLHYDPRKSIQIKKMQENNEIATINNSAVKMLQKINSHTDSLEKTVAQRTKELHEANSNLENRVQMEVKKRLFYEKELIQKSRFELMGEMIDSIAHQWRQPLMSINSILLNIDQELENSHYLQKDFAEQKVLELENMTHYMSHTIEDFRNFFRKDKQKEDISLTVLLKNAKQLLQSNLGNITLTITMHQSIHLQGYFNELLQVVVSILDNAIHLLHSQQKDRKTINISVHENESSIIIKISDNAGGIQMTNIQDIFKPYVSTKHSYQGSGLGLYICKIIIEESIGGAISVQNIDDGACFTIKLPKEETET
ncbi:MAG: ATP-binding protein [Sulfurimonas sp.]|nr:ATP-binding protein [Sulfurimonas sp.]